VEGIIREEKSGCLYGDDRSFKKSEAGFG